MPVYNAEKYVEQAMQSIIDQTYRNWELLICDDASVDGSWKILQKYAQRDNRIKLFFNQCNLGSLRSRNRLFGEAKGEFIAFQDADDYSDCTRLMLQLQEFNKYSSLMMCGTWADYRTLSKGVFKVKRGEVEYDDILTKHISSNQFCSASIMIRREVLDRIGMYREYFFDKGNYDYDFTMRVSEKFMVRNLNKILYHVNVLAESNSKNVFGNLLKLESHNIVQILARERISYNDDSIQRNDFDSIRRMEEDLLRKYTKNPMLKYDRIINVLLDNFLYKDAFFASLKIWCLHPIQLDSIKLLLYVARRCVFRY